MMKETFFKAILEAGLAEPRLCFVTAGADPELVRPIGAHLGDRVVTVDGEDVLGVALGLAHAGRLPVVYEPSGRATARYLETLRNHICLRRANVKLVVREEGLALPRLLPGMHVLAPADERETQVLTEAMIGKIEGPCWLRLDGRLVSPSRGTDRLDVVPFLPRVLRSGNDVVILGSGGVLEQAFEAAEQLRLEGIETRLVSLHGIRPLATHALSAHVAGSWPLFTLEDGEIEGGLGGAVAEWLAETGVAPAVFHRLGLRHGISTLTASLIAEQVRFFVGAMGTRTS